MCIYKAKQILPLNVKFYFNPVHAKKLYHVFDIVDTALSYERSFLQDLQGKEKLAIILQ